MTCFFKLKRQIFFALLVLFSISPVFSAVPQKGSMVLGGVNLEVWGSYKIKPMLFPSEEWEFFVVVVPLDVRQGGLIKVAKEFYAKYPNVRARFFSDKKHIQQYVDRDRYVNDKTGSVREVSFPSDEWVQNHLLGNINNRSSTYQRRWMLEDRYGNNIVLLP
ncbi:hypothetical protein [Azospira sp.]|uniref:hypothetical protein n=1 Tax=Azospira sp. TaxID=1872671 RepID=UPI00255EAD76|nr:hypothetical protein [Azospira sp.]MDK9692142.1 hypothetical protein [Azospira sp.]